jgi:hypothetical protein
VSISNLGEKCSPFSSRVALDNDRSVSDTLPEETQHYLCICTLNCLVS